MSKEPLYPHKPSRRQSLYPHVAPGRTAIYQLQTDSMGNIIITKLDDPGKDAFIQFESDKDVIYNLLRQDERRDLDAGWKVRIKGTEIRASTLDEIWATSAQPSGRGVWLSTLASTEGDPIRKFCCRLCGDCAPSELLEEGRFLDRISWLRRHYQEKHPGKWGTMTPMTVERGEPVSPEHRHLASLVRDPLPKEAD